MRSRRFLFVVSTVSVLAAGCRQPDGPLPSNAQDEAGRMSDVAKDLQNIASGDANGPQEFADDIRVWATSVAGPWAPADELSRRLTTALKGTLLPDEAAAQLSRLFWVASAGRELSDRQIGRLQDDLREALLKLGVAEDAARAVGDQIGELQGAVTEKKRRWWQLL